MSVDKQEFITRFRNATVRACQFAAEFLVESVPSRTLFTFEARKALPDKNGRIKFLGGKLLLPSELCNVELERAARLLWVDGRVPKWINVNLDDIADDHAILLLCHSAVLVKDLEDKMENAPFRIRGPAVPHGWNSLDQNGRFSIAWRKVSDE